MKCGSYESCLISYLNIKCWRSQAASLDGMNKRHSGSEQRRVQTKNVTNPFPPKMLSGSLKARSRMQGKH